MHEDKGKIEYEPLISIVIPAYNAEKYISQTLDSVLAQTYTNYEVIVIDDCSRDSTADILSCYASKDSRIRVLKNEQNCGVSYTRNRAVSLANAKWIAFVDSDDIWDPEKLELQVKLLQKKPDAVILYTGSAFINSEGQKSQYILQVPEEMSFKELLKQNRISCSSVIIDTEYIKKYSMPGGNMHEDYAVWLQVLAEGAKAYGINKPLLIYRLTASSKSGNKIQAAGMTYRVYKFIGLGFFSRMKCMWFYIWRSLRKYMQIRQGLKINE